jgi:hypothetical protein
MLRWLARCLGLEDPYADFKREARLSVDDALTIAREAGAGVSDVHSLSLVAVESEGDDRLWVFATASRGSVWQVKVRDRDGVVVNRGRVGKR